MRLERRTRVSDEEGTCLTDMPFIAFALFTIGCDWARSHRFLLFVFLVLVLASTGKCQTAEVSSPVSVLKNSERDEAARHIFWSVRVLHSQMATRRDVPLDERLREIKKVLILWDKVVKRSGYRPTHRQLEVYEKAQAFVKARGLPEP
jgi:hypothetical protein